MKTTIFVSILLLLLTQSVAAQEGATDEVERGLIYAAEMKGAQVPDGPAFRMIVMWLTMVDHENAIDTALAELDIEDRNEASRFVDLIVSLRPTIEEAVRVEKKGTACSEGDGYELMAQLYDDENRVWGQYLDQARQSLSSEGQAGMNKWVTKMKRSMSHKRLDFKALDQRDGGNRLETLTRLCQGE